jgi:hypothetical protein
MRGRSDKRIAEQSGESAVSVSSWKMRMRRQEPSRQSPEKQNETPQNSHQSIMNSLDRRVREEGSLSLIKTARMICDCEAIQRNVTCRKKSLAI